MNIPAFMLYGDPSELADYLSGDLATELSDHDLRAALANALNRIAACESKLTILRRQLEAVEVMV